MDLLMSIWKGLRVLAGALLGRWVAPSWLRGLLGLVQQAALFAWARFVVRRQLYVLCLFFGAGALAVAYIAYLRLEARSGLGAVTMSVQAPGLTDYAKSGVPEPVVLAFSAPVAPPEAVGKPVTGVTLMPAVEGEWAWADERKLVFTPRHDWPIGAKYKGVLGPSLVVSQVHLETRAFVLETPPFHARILGAQFVQDPEVSATKNAIVQVSFSHPVNAAEFEKRVDLRLAERGSGFLGLSRQEIPFRVVFDASKTRATIHSANLPIPKESSRLDISISKGVMAQAGGQIIDQELRASVTVPGLYALGVEGVRAQVIANDRFEPERVLTLTMSQSVLERDMSKSVMAWLLPEFKPGSQPEASKGALKLYEWSDVNEVSSKVLAESVRLELVPVPSEHDHAREHSFKFKADPGRAIYVQVEPQLKSFGGYLLPQRSAHIMKVQPLGPDLRIMSRGAILPMSGEKKLAVLTRDLPGLKLEIGRVQPSQLHHLVSQAQGSYLSPEFSGGFNADNITDRFEREIPLPPTEPGKNHLEALDLAGYFFKDQREGESRRGLFLIQLEGFDPKSPAELKPVESAGEGAEGVSQSGHASTRLRERRLIVVSDLGIVMKQSVDGGRDVFVHSLYSGVPVAGASVEVIAKNGSSLVRSETGSLGHVRFEPLEGVIRERSPLMILVRKGGDFSFLPLGRGERTLDLSRFDVGGLSSEQASNSLSAYLFSDRGLYRPGDTMNLGVIVRPSEWRQALDGIPPLEVEIVDPRGLAVKRERIRLGPEGFSEVRYTTLEGSVAGNYTVNVHAIKEGELPKTIGSTVVKVQEFEPDRTKVSIALSSPSTEGWVHPAELKARISAQNLMGNPAGNRRVQVSLALSPGATSFRGFADYRFYGAHQAAEPITETLPEVLSDSNGDAVLDLNLQRFSKATYRMSLLSKVWESEGGGSASAEVTALVSEMPYLLGVKHDGELGHVTLGSDRGSHLIAVDPRAKKRAVDGLKLQFIERKTVSVLVRQANDAYRYESRRKDTVLSESVLNIPLNGYDIKLDTRKAGNFSYVVRDPVGYEVSRIDFSVVGQGNVTRSLERHTELQLGLNKADYMPGDEIEVSVRAPYVGSGLITIERDKVYAQAWFKTSTTASLQKIRLPVDFQGSGYVSVHFVRDPGSEEVFASPLSYGVVPFVTHVSGRTHQLKLEVPEVARPGQPLNIKLQVSRPTRAVVYAVDEGVLQVARYQHPDPLGHFFQKRALEVKTSQILDLLMPEFSRWASASAPGGDNVGFHARFLNPFKRKGEAPPSFWSGLVDVSGEGRFTFTLPDHFQGALRVMAVAVNGDSVGVAQSTVNVRGDFVLSPYLPVAVSPGDVFDVPVGVANQLMDSAPESPVLVAIRVPPAFEVLGPASQTLKLGPIKEGFVSFRVKVKDAAATSLGPVSLRFLASLGSKSAVRRLDINIRPTLLPSTTQTFGYFRGAAELAVSRDLLPELRKQELSISTLPLALAPPLLTYLERFEHRSTEHIVSRALPSLMLARRPEWGVVTPQLAVKLLDEAIRVLRVRQNAKGGFGLWAATPDSHEYASVYAAHLLVEASDADLPQFSIPEDMLRAVRGYLEVLAASPPVDLPTARIRAYAIYLLARQGVLTTAQLASLREFLDLKFKTEWKSDSVAALLAATYQILQQDKAAAELIGGLIAQTEKAGSRGHGSSSYDQVTRDAQIIYLAARHFPARLRAIKPEVVTRFLAPISEGYITTLSAAHALLALEAMARTMNSQVLSRLSVESLNAKGSAVPLSLPPNIVARMDIPAGTVRMKLSHEASPGVFYAIAQSGLDRVPASLEAKSGLEVHREYLDSKGRVPSTVKVGDELLVRLTLRGVGPTGATSMVPGVAITDLIPGGFEPVQGWDERGMTSTVTGPGLEFADIRDDRVVIYTQAGPNPQTFTYRMRVIQAGEFTVPPTFAESLYERSKQARSGVSRLTAVSK